MNRPKVKTIGPKTKRWRELQSRRSFKPLHRVHVHKQHNKSSFMQDPPSARQNAKETSTQIYNNMSTKNNKDIVFPTNPNNNSLDKKPLLDENPKEILEMTPVNPYKFNEEYRKSTFDNDKDKKQESLDVHEDKKKQDDNRIKTVRWLDEAEKSLMDLGISEDDRNKRLESLMERRRSKKLSSFQVRTNGMGMGIGNSSCGQISSLNIPKKNPFLADNSQDPDSPAPVSAPSYMVKSNPFDLPYDPHEEKPILTFEEDFNNSSHQKFGNFAPPEFTKYKHKAYFDSDFTIKQLPSGRLVTSTVENKEDDKKQLQRETSNPDHGTNDTKEKENKEDDKKQPQQDGDSSEKIAEKVVDITDEEKENTKKEKEIKHESSSSSSSSCSEDEPIMRPNKEAILHCLSMSRMRVVSQGKSFHRHAETFDCGPSALFDKTKTDCFFFGGNKKVHYASTNSIASDMQVEVSEAGSPPLSSLDGRLKGGLDDSSNSFEMDFNDVRLSDMDDFSDEGSVESGFWRSDHDSHEKCTFEKL